MPVKVDISALKQSILVFKTLHETSEIPMQMLGQYLESPGILFLKKHLLYYGATVFNEALLSQLLESVITDPVPRTGDSVFLRSMKHGLKHVGVLEQEFNVIDMDAAIQKAVILTNKYLPNEMEEDVNVHFLYGIRGTGITLENEIAIDICDEYISRNGILDINNLTAILAHEFHHIGVDKHVSDTLHCVEDARLRLLVNFLRGLLSEGTAYNYLPSPYEEDGAMGVQWSKNLSNISTILVQISDYISQICSGTLVDLTETHHLFGNGLEGYTAGYMMIDAITSTFGENAVLNCIEDCLLFPQLYNIAVKKGNLGLPTMNYSPY